MKSSLIGRRHGQLVILGLFNAPRADLSKRPYRKACCRCDCGAFKDVTLSALSAGQTKSCGCMRRFDPTRKSATRLYRVWANMVGRTTRPSATYFDNYGGRGIKPDPAWLDFESFKLWAEANGYADHLSLERLDNDVGYTAANCVWIERSLQNRNRRTNKMNQSRADQLRRRHGEGVSISDLISEFGISRTMVNNIVNGVSWVQPTLCACCGRP